MPDPHWFVVRSSYVCCLADAWVVRGKPFPSFIDVTIEDLAIGLETGLFTSVDLVKVPTLETFDSDKIFGLICGYRHIPIGFRKSTRL